MTMEIAIKAEHLTKRYDNKYALQDFSIQLPVNRVIGVLGANGAGKSTFFRMITGMVQPDQGRFEVFGKKPGWETNALISYLPDRAQWYKFHTVQQALEWGDALLPGFDKKRAESLLDFMNLDPTMKVEGMSRGQEARLMLTLCMCRDVPMLVLDEPFAGIDLISRERIIGALIDNLSERQQTVLVSTHEIQEAESLFDYALFMNAGQALLHGDVEMLRAERGSMESIYRNLYR